jgi:hypothetical protein
LRAFEIITSDDQTTGRIGKFTGNPSSPHLDLTFKSEVTMIRTESYGNIYPWKIEFHGQEGILCSTTQNRATDFKEF